MATEALPQDAVEVGRVLGAWGIKGGIKVKPFAADAQALFSSKRWFIQPPETIRPGAAQLPTLLRIVTAKEQGDGVVATAQELPDRKAAEAMRGARIFISRATFPKPDDGEFYWIDLIGMAVFDRADQRLGEVVGLIETGPHCVLRVQPDAPIAARAGDPGDGVLDNAAEAVAGAAAEVDADADADVETGVVSAAAAAAEMLIPFVDAYVDAVDLPGRRISVDWDASY